jgi:hypothetical protein
MTLDLKVRRTADGRFDVTWAVVDELSAEESMVIKENGLTTISPAIKTYLSMDKNFSQLIHGYHRTSMDAITLPRTGEVAFVKDSKITDIYGLEKVLGAHRHSMPFVIGEEKAVKELYDAVDSLEQEGLAFRTKAAPRRWDSNDWYNTSEYHRSLRCDTGKFGEGLAKFIFDDEALGINAEQIGKRLRDECRLSDVQVFIRNPIDIAKFGLPQLFIVNIFDPDSYCWVKADGDFSSFRYVLAVHMKPSPNG